MRTASYSRVSSQEQVDGLSLAAQKRGITEYCASKDWDPPHHYVDKGRSARSEAIDKRPALVSLLDACASGQYDVVVVYSIDRWARNLAVTLETFGSLANAGVTFASVTESIDYTTPEGRLFVAMLGAFAQYFSDSLAKHTSKGVAERVHQGRPAGPLPFGYRTDKRDVPQPVPEEAEAVREIFRMRTQGRPQSEIATWLNSREFRTRAGNHFTNFAVRDILNNPFYAGRIRYRGDTYDGAHEALIDISTFELIQAAKGRRRAPAKERSYLLKGLVRCVQCGRPLWATSPHHGYTYYRQQGSGGECPVGEASVKCETIDDQLERLVASLRLERNWRDTVIQRVVALSEKERIASERKHAEARLKRLGRAYVDDLISERAYQSEKRQLKERISSLVIPEVDLAVEAGALLEQVQDLWAEATLGERHELLAGMIDAVYIDLRSRLVVGVLPKPSFRQAFSTLEGDLLIPAEEADRILLWWRRRGIEPLVQMKAHPNVYKLSCPLISPGARLTAGLPPGQPESLRPPLPV